MSEPRPARQFVVYSECLRAVEICFVCPRLSQPGLLRAQSARKTSVIPWVGFDGCHFPVKMICKVDKPVSLQPTDSLAKEGVRLVMVRPETAHRRATSPPAEHETKSSKDQPGLYSHLVQTRGNCILVTVRPEHLSSLLSAMGSPCGT